MDDEGEEGCDRALPTSAQRPQGAPSPRAHRRLGREGERGRVRGGRAEEEEDGRRHRGPMAVGGWRWLQRHNRAEERGAAGQDAQKAAGSGVRRIRPWRHRIRQIRRFGPPPARQTEPTRLHPRRRRGKGRGRKGESEP